MTVATDKVDGVLWLSMAEIGRRRGKSREAIRKRVDRWVGDGVLSTRPGPRGATLVNIVAFDRLASDDTDPAQALRNGGDLDGEGESAAVANAGSAGEENSGDKSPGSGSFAAARADRESYQAENARLDLEERLGRLADREEVGRLQMDVFRRVRDRLLSVPARIQDRLASAPDGPAMRRILTEELRRELDGLADKLEALASEGGELDLDIDDGASTNSSSNRTG